MSEPLRTIDRSKSKFRDLQRIHDVLFLRLARQ
jgi:hypothetical protein